jgi:hypothetical protein
VLPLRNELTRTKAEVKSLKNELQQRESFGTVGMVGTVGTGKSNRKEIIFSSLFVCYFVHC